MRRSTMHFSSGLLLAAAAVAIAVSACGGNDQPPPQQPGATTYPQQPPPDGYYQQQGYPQQGYPQQGYPQQGYPQQPGGYTPAPAETMATPGPLALPCQNDSACGLHRCNVQHQKCAFPCQGPVDCAGGNQCLMGVCAPLPPGSQ